MKKNIYALVLALFLLSCCKHTVKNEQPELQGKPSIEKNTTAGQISISPGTALIKGLILENTPGNDFINLKIRVNEVINYGAAFPPLPQGTEISAGMSKDVFDSVNKIEPITIDKSFILLLQNQIKSSGNGNNIWNILQIKPLNEK